MRNKMTCTALPAGASGISNNLTAVQTWRNRCLSRTALCPYRHLGAAEARMLSDRDTPIMVAERSVT